jgi:hypothetical protein
MADVGVSRGANMAEPRQPEKAKGAKSGVKDGATPNTPGQKGGKRPIEEEDVFGGAERAQKGQRIDSDKAKP